MFLPYPLYRAEDHPYYMPCYYIILLCICQDKFENKNDFLTAYGYKIEKAASGRPSTSNENIIEESKSVEFISIGLL